MALSKKDELTYYAKYGKITDPGIFLWLFESLPTNISDLCRVIQGFLVHVFWAERYGEILSEERQAEPGIRHVEKLLGKLQQIAEKPIVEKRSLNHRLVGNCRTFSVLLASMLQSQGTPARARCGFGRYFKPGWYEGHWVCEYWRSEQNRDAVNDVRHVRVGEKPCRQTR